MLMSVVRIVKLFKIRINVLLFFISNMTNLQIKYAL